MWMFTLVFIVSSDIIFLFSGAKLLIFSEKPSFLAAFPLFRRQNYDVAMQSFCVAEFILPENYIVPFLNDGLGQCIHSAYFRRLIRNSMQRYLLCLTCSKVGASLCCKISTPAGSILQSKPCAGVHNTFWRHIISNKSRK